MRNKHHSVLRIVMCVAAFATVVGCATSQGTKPDEVPKTTALVCPECKTVTLGPFPSNADYLGGPPATLTRHECGGCRGIISMRPDGQQFKHECSLCKQSPFSCQPTHTP